MNSVWYFRSPSILRTVILLPRLRKSSLVYFHRGGFPRKNRGGRWRKKAIRLLLRLLAPKVEVREIPPEWVYEENWQLNAEGLRFVEDLEQAAASSVTYRVIGRLLGDPHSIKTFKAMLARDIPDELLFARIVARLNEGRESLCAVRGSGSPPGLSHLLEDRAILELEHVEVVPPGERFIRLLEWAGALLHLVAVPGLFALYHVARLKVRLRRGDLPRYDVAMPVIWGFRNSEDTFAGVVSPHDDGYLYGSEFVPGEIVHVFGLWRSPPDVEDRFRRCMERQGLAYADRDDYRASLSLLVRLLGIQFEALAQLGRHLRSVFRESSLWLRYGARVVYWSLLKELELNNIDYRVELIRHDYDPRHVVDTIVCNSRGRSTLGIQHAGSRHDLPQLSFVHVNKYAIFCEFYVKKFAPYWESLDLVHTGRENVDWVVEAASRLEGVGASPLNESVRRRTYSVVFLLPSAQEHVLQSRWNALYESLVDFRTLQIDATLFLRFRRADDLCDPLLERFSALPAQDPRIVIDHTFATTYELIAASDLVIANTASFAIFEAVAVNRTVFTFDFLGTGSLDFSGYGRDFVLTNSEDLLRVLAALEEGFDGFDCAWDALRADGDSYRDGRNRQRLQRAVSDLVSASTADGSVTDYRDEL